VYDLRRPGIKLIIGTPTVPIGVYTRQVLGYLREAARELGITVLCNLHQVDYAKEFSERIVGMSRGAVVFEGPPAQLTDEILHRIYYREPGEAAQES